MELNTFHALAISVGLGLLVGMERQWAAKDVAGIRTFPLITVFGTLCALLAGDFGLWLVPAGLIAVASMLFLGNLAQFQKGRVDAGLTTEFAALVMFVVGAAVATDFIGPAVVATGAVAILLFWKQPLHEFVGRIGEADFRALIRLVLIGLVILPLLPDEAIGPEEVVNPYEIWLMVVLIVGISMAAYVVYKLLGGKIGTLLAGVFGGLISSTAATVGYARLTKKDAAHASTSAVLVVIASTTVFARVLVEIGIVAPGILEATAPPIVAMMLLMVAISAVTFFLSRKTLADFDPESAPADLKGPIFFGLMYAAVLLGVALAKDQTGQAGLYVVAAISGLTDMDAITLSTAQLVKAQRLDATTGWRMILLGAMANLVFKALMVAVLGNVRMLRLILPAFAAGLAGGAAILLLWP